jgi:hypothetical protein
MPTGVPGSGKGRNVAKSNGKRPARRVKRRKPEESFITPSLLRSLPRAGIGVREGAALSSILAKMTEAVITRP